MSLSAHFEEAHGNTMAVLDRQAQGPVSRAAVAPPVEKVTSEDVARQSLLATASMVSRAAQKPAATARDAVAWNGVSSLSADNFHAASPEAARAPPAAALPVAAAPEAEPALSSLHFPVRPPPKDATLEPAPWGGISRVISVSMDDDRRPEDSPATARARATSSDAAAAPPAAGDEGANALDPTLLALAGPARGRAATLPAVQPAEWSGLSAGGLLGDQHYNVAPSPSPPKRRAGSTKPPGAAASPKGAPKDAENYAEQYAHAKPLPAGTMRRGSYFDVSPLSSVLA